jgi:hypothetical protein
LRAENEFKGENQSPREKLKEKVRTRKGETMAATRERVTQKQNWRIRSSQSRSSGVSAWVGEQTNREGSIAGPSKTRNPPDLCVRVCDPDSACVNPCNPDPSKEPITQNHFSCRSVSPTSRWLQRSQENPDSSNDPAHDGPVHTMG